MIMFFVTLLLISSISNSMQMQEINREPKEFPRTLIMRDQIELDEHVDARYANKYRISFAVDKDDAKKICISASWKHWFDGWRRTVCKNSLPKLNNDQIEEIRSGGLCALKYPFVLCALAATMSREGGEKYDVCWLVRYNLVERASALFFL